MQLYAFRTTFPKAALIFKKLRFLDFSFYLPVKSIFVPNLTFLPHGKSLIILTISEAVTEIQTLKFSPFEKA